MTGLVGYHTSSAKAYSNAIQNAIDLNLQTFQFFLGSPRTWSYKDIDTLEVDVFKENLVRSPFNITTVHMNYLPNPSSDDPALQEKTLTALTSEIERCDLLGVNNLVIHIGSHKGRGFDNAKYQVAEFLNHGISLDPSVNLLLETSAGQSNAVGSTFDEIAEIFELATTSEKVGVCFDTCHVFAAGYDISTSDGIEDTLQLFDDTIGINRLKVIHANDSMGKLGEGKDRHENIGYGNIGKDAFNTMINHPLLDNRPFILETLRKHLHEDIALLRKFVGLD